MYSQFVSYIGFCSTEEDQIQNRVTLHVAIYIVNAMPADDLHRHTSQVPKQLHDPGASEANLKNMGTKFRWIRKDNITHTIIINYHQYTTQVKHQLWLFLWKTAGYRRIPIRKRL